MNLLPLLGIAVVIAGFVLRVNPLLTMVTGGIVTAALAGFGPIRIIELFGEGFTRNRLLLLAVNVLLQWWPAAP